MNFVLKNAGLTELAVKNILKQLSSALKYLHDSMNIVHRDLKPDNMLVSSYNLDNHEVDIKLVDFGFASDGTLESKAKLGSPIYMAPELYHTNISNDFKVDIWAFGIIAFQLLSGNQ